MSRPPRLEFPAALYHVTARGNERREIFRDDRDREEYLARLAHYREKFGFQLLAYCLMTNHVHLAILTGDAPLSRTMAGLHSTYAEWFNRRHGRVGHLFQGRYKAHVVQEDRYLVALVRYIHRNPVRAGIVRRAADYRWSSDRFVRRGRGPAWLDVDRLLPLLDSPRARAIERYVEIVDGPRAGPSYDSVKPVDRVVVGDEHFATMRFEAAADPEPPLRGLDLDRLLAAVARDFGFSATDLEGPKRGGHVAAARCVAAYIARRYGCISVRRVARRLRRDDSTFTRPLATLEHRLDTDNTLRAQIDRIVLTLRQPNPKSANQD